jgi:hypothetical protein
MRNTDHIALKVSEKGFLRRRFRPEREEVRGGLRILHNEELHNLYSSSDVIRMITLRRMRLTGHAAHMGDGRNAYRILVGKPVRKRSLVRRMCS